MRVLLFVAAFALSSALQDLKVNDPCINPNQENGTCIAVSQCRPINQALTYLEDDAIAFARQSQCGYDEGPLVCCGKTGKFPPATTSTLPPSTTIEFNREPSQTASPLNYQLLPDSSLCGFHITDGKAKGKATEITEFPWMAALIYTASDGTPAGVRCSGTLINQRYILTAAQCLNIPGYTLAKVRLGEWKLSTAKDCVSLHNEEYCAELLDLPIVETTAHPYYNTKSGNNDIALLRVARKVNYNDFIRPICLPPNDFPPPAPGDLMYISGWNISEDGTQPDVKSKTTIITSSNRDCNKTHPDFLRLHPNMACAGGEPERNSCNGDSGGALLRTYESSDQLAEEQWFLEGIIYRGTGCQVEKPALYLRVSRYIYWILNNIKYS